MHQRTGKLLLVDGEVGRAQRLAKRLAHLDVDVHVSDNGADGLLKAHEIQPDMVVSATEMPILDGYRMLEALKSKPQTCNIPVVLITDECNHEELSRGWTAGADLCIPRNQGEADVLATLRRVISSVSTRGFHLSELALAS